MRAGYDAVEIAAKEGTVEAKERPILFSGPMVRAILEGRKTQTRRVVKHAHDPDGPAGAVHPARESGWIAWWPGDDPLGELPEFTKREYRIGFHCPYGQPGDRLWVRETWRISGGTTGCGLNTAGVEYKAGGDRAIGVGYRDAEAAKAVCHGWRPSIHMPRWASRLTLEVTGVRVERVQEITPIDAVAEGLRNLRGGGQTLHACYGRSAIGQFQALWDSINAKRGHGWEQNPWVWVVAFRPLGKES